MAKRKRRTFTPEFKADVMWLAEAGDRTIGQVAKDLDLTDMARHGTGLFEGSPGASAIGRACRDAHSTLFRW